MDTTKRTVTPPSCAIEMSLPSYDDLRLYGDWLVGLRLICCFAA
jgi:hypothetical protein